MPDRLSELKQTLDDAAETARVQFVEEPGSTWFEASFEWLRSQTGFAALVGDEHIGAAIIAARLGAERACAEDRPQFTKLEEGLLQWAADHPSRGPRVVRDARVGLVWPEPELVLVLDPASSVSCVSSWYWVDAAETQQTFHSESGMRYQVSS